MILYHTTKLFLKNNFLSVYRFLKYIRTLIDYLKCENGKLITYLLSLIKIELNLQINPTMNLSYFITINLYGFDHRFSIRIKNYLYMHKTNKIYNLKKIERKIKIIQKNTHLDGGSFAKQIVPLSFVEYFLLDEGNFHVKENIILNINLDEYIYFNNSSNKLIVIDNKWAFFHFYIQIIPYVNYINNRKKFSILLKKQKQKYFRDLLELFFFKQFKKITVDQYNKSKTYKIYNNNIYPNKKHIIYLRNFIKKRLNLNYEKKVENLVYILRTKGTKEEYFNRTIYREKYLIDTLKKKYNFKIIDPNNKNISEQIKIFNSCKGVISLHGANLSNLIALNKECKILELNNDYDVKWHYHKIINDLMNLKNHNLLLCKTHKKKLKINFKNFFNLVDELFI